MKKAFEQNVSRTRPRVKLGGLVEEPAPPAEVAPPASPAPRAAQARPETSSEPARSGRREEEAVSEMLARHAVSPPVRAPVPREEAPAPATRVRS